MATDFTLSSNTTLTIVANTTTSTGTVTITAVDNSVNDVDAPAKTVRVRADAMNTLGVTRPCQRDP